MTKYKMMADGFIDGTYREKGETVELADIEAEQLVNSGQIEKASEERPARTKLLAPPAAAGDPPKIEA